MSWAFQFRKSLAALGALALTACDPTALPQPLPPRVWLSLPAADAVQCVVPGEAEPRFQTEVGMLPHTLLPSADGQFVYVALTGSQAIAEMDAATGALRRTFLTEPVPATRANGTAIEEHVTLNASAHSTCFACHGAGTARPAVVGSRPYGLVLSEDGEHLFVTHQRSGNLSKIHLATGSLSAVIPVEPSGSAHEPTAIGRVGASLFLTVLPTLPSLAPAVLRRLDEQGVALGPDTALGSNAGALTVDADRAAIYVSNFESNTVTALSTSGEQGERYLVGNGPFGSVLNDDALLVANYYDNAVSRVALSSGEVTTRALGFEGRPRVNPTHLQKHDGVLYVLSSGTSGHLLALDPETLETRAETAVAGLPFDLLVLP